MNNAYKKLFKTLCTFIIFICVNGCTPTILDMHNRTMEKNPNNYHYATAVPFFSGFSRIKINAINRERYSC